MASRTRVLRHTLCCLAVFVVLSATSFAGDIAGSLYLDNLKLAPDVTSGGSTPDPSTYSVQLNTEEIHANELTLKKFPSNLGRNFASLFSRQNLMPLLAGLSVTGAAAGLDDKVEDYFEVRNTRTLFANTGARVGRPYVLVPAIGTLFVAGLSSKNERFKGFSYSLAQGFVLDLGITQGLKQVSGRTRPDGSNDYSFPSGHSTDSFMIATVVDQFYGHKAGFVAYGAAALISASRLKSNVHWLSDVAAGATIGYIIGRTVSRNAAAGLQFSKHVQIAPSIDPIGKQYGFAMTINLP